MEESKFTYCEGNGCTKKKSCSRYTEGKRVETKTEGFWWQKSCSLRLPPVKEFVSHMGVIGRMLYYARIIKIIPVEKIFPEDKHRAKRVARWCNPLTYLLCLLLFTPILAVTIVISFIVAFVITFDLITSSDIILNEKK